MRPISRPTQRTSSVPASFRSASHRRGRSGQTLVDYCLILAMVTLIGIQEIEDYEMYLHTLLIYNNASFICAEVVAQNPQLSGVELDNGVMASVDQYLDNTSTWAGIPSDVAESSSLWIHNTIYEQLYGEPDPSG